MFATRLPLIEAVGKSLFAVGAFSSGLVDRQLGRFHRLLRPHVYRTS